jgi:hypothetical protein
LHALDGMVSSGCRDALSHGSLRSPLLPNIPASSLYPRDLLTAAQQIRHKSTLREREGMHPFPYSATFSQSTRSALSPLASAGAFLWVTCQPSDDTLVAGSVSPKRTFPLRACPQWYLHYWRAFQFADPYLISSSMTAIPSRSTAETDTTPVVALQRHDPGGGDPRQ